MLAIARDWKQKREDLRKQRASLSAEFEKSPTEVILALKLKAIDNEIAECTEHMVKEKAPLAKTTKSSAIRENKVPEEEQMISRLNDFLDRVRNAFARIFDSVKKHHTARTRSEEMSFAGVCPFCGLLTPRKGSRCLECGKSLKLA